MKDCIFAVATAVASGAVAMIRLSGRDAVEVAENFFIPFKSEKLSNLNGYEAAYGKFVQDGEILDDGVALVYLAPNSYTGENVVELFCHGGPYIVSQVLNLCNESGARLAQNGEFTKRAFLNGKLSLTEAEAVMELINADSKASFKAAKNLKNGVLFKKLKQICTKLEEIYANVQAVLEYPDEDVEDIDVCNIKAKLQQIELFLKELVDGAKISSFLKNGIKTVIVGSPNVGKSTIMNMLCGTEKSIVTNRKGTTRDVVEALIQIDGVNFRLCDTAGIWSAEDEIEKIGVFKAKETLKNADLILFIVDGSRKVLAEDLDILKNCEDIPKIYVSNKFDLGFTDFYSKGLSFEGFLKTSKEDRGSIEKLKEKMFECVGLNKLNQDAFLMFNERQNVALKLAYSDICEVLKLIEKGEYLEVIGSFIESAIDKILELSGEKVSDKVVDDIFSKFCVGK